MEKTFLSHKKARSEGNESEQKKKIKYKLFISLAKNESPESRNITIHLADGSKIIQYFPSYLDLQNYLDQHHIQHPYYKINDRDIKLYNIREFFKIKNLTEIYNQSISLTLDERRFIQQINDLPDENQKLNSVNNIFLNFDLFFKNHLPGYQFINFQNLDIDFNDFLNNCFIIDIKKNVINEVFGQKGIGCSTYFYFILTYYRLGQLFRFIPFIYWDLNLLYNQKSIENYFQIIQQSVASLFRSYDELKNFWIKIQNDVFKNFHNEWTLLDIIIDTFSSIYKVKKRGYHPIIFITNYSDSKDVDNKIQNLKKKILEQNLFKILIRYNLNTQNSNIELINYLENIKSDMFFGIYSSNLYPNLKDLKSKYPNIMKKIGYTIENYINLENCNSEDDIKKLVEEKEKFYKRYIEQFYYNDSNKKYFYLNLSTFYIGKSYSITDIRNLLLNIPLDLFNIDCYYHLNENKFIKLEYNNDLVKNLINEICENNIKNIFYSYFFHKSENYVKGGIFEKLIKVLFKNGETPFGNFNDIFYLDCFINKIDFNKKTKEDIYNFVNKNDNINKLKNNLKNKSIKNGNYLFFQLNKNGKDFDMCLSKGNKLCSIQISINKSIEKIKEIMKNIDSKKYFILKKLEKIFPELILKEFHILFILLQNTQDKSTLDFCNSYNIPYILVDNELNFYNKNEIIKMFELNEFTNFDEKISDWKESLDDYIIKNESFNKKEILFEDLDNNNEEEYDKNDIQNNNVDLKDIIYNPEIYDNNNYNFVKTLPCENNKNLIEEKLNPNYISIDIVDKLKDWDKDYISKFKFTCECKKFPNLKNRKKNILYIIKKEGKLNYAILFDEYKNIKKKNFEEPSKINIKIKVSSKYSIEKFCK